MRKNLLPWCKILLPQKALTLRSQQAYQQQPPRSGGGGGRGQSDVYGRGDRGRGRCRGKQGVTSQQQ